MPLDLGDDTARCAPAPGLIAERRVQAPDVVRRPTHGSAKQMSDLVLQYLVGRQADRVFDSLRLKVLVHAWHRKGRVATEANPGSLSLVASDDGLEDRLPVIGTVNVARPKRASFEVAELFEHEERMVTGTAEMAVPGALLLLAMGRTLARVHIQHDLAIRF